MNDLRAIVPDDGAYVSERAILFRELATRVLGKQLHTAGRTKEGNV